MSKAVISALSTQKLSANVNQNRDWQDAINAAGPDTPDTYKVRELEEKYQPISEETEEIEFILLNFCKGGCWDDALEWAESNGHGLTNPREAFAVAEQHDLIKILGIDDYWVQLVSTTECLFKGRSQTCCVSKDWSEQRAYMDYLDSFENDSYWFLFRYSSEEIK